MKLVTAKIFSLFKLEILIDHKSRAKLSEEKQNYTKKKDPRVFFVSFCRMIRILQVFIIVLGTVHVAHAFVAHTVVSRCTNRSETSYFAQIITEQEARKNIDRVVAALRKDKQANEEIGRLESVTNILGYGSPIAGSVAVRFNASFRKGGFGRSSVPLPFGLGQTNQSEGRGTMVGQVKASVDTKNGKVTSCSVFRDLGYGRAFNLKC